MKLFVALFSLASTVLAGITDCGTNPLFTITQLRQSPDTYVKPGDNTTLTLFYKVPEVITGGTATTSLSLNGIPFSPSTENLCTNVDCPITTGEHDGSSWTTFPSGVSGRIVSKVVWNDPQGKELLCIKSTFTASSYLKNNHNGQVNMLEGIVTAKPMKKKVSKELVPYIELFSGNSTATGSSGSGSGSRSGSFKKLRGGK